MSLVKLQIIAIESAYIPAKGGKKIVQLHEILQIGLPVKNMVQYPGAANLIRSNFHFLAMVIVHIQQT